MTKLEIIRKIISLTKDAHELELEGSLIKYIIEEHNIAYDDIHNLTLNTMISYAKQEYIELFRKNCMPTDIEAIVDFHEAMLGIEDKSENGIVFTPMYISDFMVRNSMQNFKTDDLLDLKIIDPGCGSGIFLISIIKYLIEHSGYDYDRIIENIYGLDISEKNVRRSKISILLYVLINRKSIENLEPNIIEANSLSIEWNKRFNVTNFDLIIGNPPYVNIHDMSKETISFLKENFRTTTAGVFNIFYAFIEHGLKFLTEKGHLNFIVPNNFLTIKSATDLRTILQSLKAINSIIDFGDNMVFKPVRTYNCIINLSKKENNEFDYTTIARTDNIEEELNKIVFNKTDINKLDKNGWHLIDTVTRDNIQKIENQFLGIKNYIRTGIATLMDDVYIIDEDEDGLFKLIDDERYDIEKGLVKKLYKVPELKNANDPNSVVKNIIFPYTKGESGFEILPEVDMKNEYPKTHSYFLKVKERLESRDKGKIKVPVWYAFGRTQGLNKYGRKLLFPTFSNKPKFTLIDDEYALFCNGYAIFDNDEIELEILVKILNSKIMQYYVSNTSYAIEGGYYCYQKKYIERFSIPLFDSFEKEFILTASLEELDEFLVKKYNIII